MQAQFDIRKIVFPKVNVWLVCFLAVVVFASCGEQPKTLEDLLKEQGNLANGSLEGQADLGALLPDLRGESEVSASANVPRGAQANNLLNLLPSRSGEVGSVGLGPSGPIVGRRVPQVPLPTEAFRPPARQNIPAFDELPNYGSDVDSLPQIQAQYRRGRYDQVVNYFAQGDFLEKQYYHAMSLYCIAIDIESPEEKSRQIAQSKGMLRRIALQARSQKLKGKAALWHGILLYLHPQGTSLSDRRKPFEFINDKLRNTTFHNDALLYMGFLHQQVGQFDRAKTLYERVKQSRKEDLIYDVNAQRFVNPHQAADHYLSRLSRLGTASQRAKRWRRRKSPTNTHSPTVVRRPSPSSSPRQKVFVESRYVDLDRALVKPANATSASSRKPPRKPSAPTEGRVPQEPSPPKQLPKEVLPKPTQPATPTNSNQQSMDGIRL